ncbi:hypothetical protein HYV73_04445 [Candidatus Uhrbacteria bacterium]|nr:hypothetical protein [Candidatus Uhrbacteria bacterium]
MQTQDRQSKVLQHLVELYIEEAEPVGSHTLVDRFALPVSSATIRNDMALLERDGFITHPHTSSGRIPTAKGYRAYLAQGVRPSKQGKAKAAFEAVVCATEEEEAVLKGLAKALAALSGETVLVAFDQHSSYYTGVSYLLRKPDFADMPSLYGIGDLVDQFDEVIPSVFSDVSDEVMIRVGEENPFGEGMSTLLVRYSFHGVPHGLLGLLGPMRMDYARNLGLMQAATESLSFFSYD